MRFCSYHNELGDYFELINSQNQIIPYDLTIEKYKTTFNFCCTDSFGKGKSIGFNYLLGEKRQKN